MTLREKIEVMEHFENGGEVEFYSELFKPGQIQQNLIGNGIHIRTERKNINILCGLKVCILE